MVKRCYLSTFMFGFIALLSTNANERSSQPWFSTQETSNMSVIAKTDQMGADTRFRVIRTVRNATNS